MCEEVTAAGGGVGGVEGNIKRKCTSLFIKLVFKGDMNADRVVPLTFLSKH